MGRVLKHEPNARRARAKPLLVGPFPASVGRVRVFRVRVWVWLGRERCQGGPEVFQPCIVRVEKHPRVSTLPLACSSRLCIAAYI